jgi:hypothetical protein
VVALADLATDQHVGTFGIDGQRPDHTAAQLDVDEAATRVPLPDPKRTPSAGIVLLLLHLADILAPAGLDAQRGGIAVHAEAHAERRRQGGAGQRHVAVGGAIVRGVGPAFGEFVGDEGRVLVVLVTGGLRGVGSLGAGRGARTPTR